MFMKIRKYLSFIPICLFTLPSLFRYSEYISSTYVPLCKGETAAFKFEAKDEPNFETQLQYNLNVFSNSDEWKTYRGDNVKIAVIDSGVNYSHEDFINENGECVISKESRQYKYDTSSNKVLFSTGLNYVNDENGHGTNVVATISSQINGVGGVGIAPNAEIVVIKTPSYINYEVYYAIKYAADIGCDIINMSFVFYADTFIDSNGVSHNGVLNIKSYLQEAINYAYNKGCVLVAAAGNDKESNHYSYPANNNHVISVGALSKNSSNTLASYSNYGKNIDVVAPGSVYVASKDSNNSYKSTQGTSFASPLIAGALALVKSKNPSLTNDDLETLLYQKTYKLNDKEKFANGLICIDDMMNNCLKFNKINWNLEDFSGFYLISNINDFVFLDGGLDKKKIITEENYFTFDNGSSFVSFSSDLLDKSFYIEEKDGVFSIKSYKNKYYLSFGSNGELLAKDEPYYFYLDFNNICDQDWTFFLSFSNEKGFYLSDENADEVTLYKLNGNLTDIYEFNVVTFINNYLHMDLYVNEINRSEGNCFNDFLLAEENYLKLNDEEKNIFMTSKDTFISSAYARYVAWKTAYKTSKGISSKVYKFKKEETVFLALSVCSLSILSILMFTYKRKTRKPF